MDGDPEFPIRWEPPTHPGWKFWIGRDPNAETQRSVCGHAEHEGEKLDDAQGCYDKVYAEHATINRALDAVVAKLPPEFFKPAMDSDGDPVLDDDGVQVMVLKDKHQPIVYTSPLGDVTGVSIPGTKHYPAPDAKKVAELSRGMAAALAADEVVARLQPLVEYDLVQSVVLQDTAKEP